MIPGQYKEVRGSIPSSGPLHPLKPNGCMLGGGGIYLGVGNEVWRAGGQGLCFNVLYGGERKEVITYSLHSWPDFPF